MPSTVTRCTKHAACIASRATFQRGCGLLLLQLGHEAYHPGTKAFSDIVAEFGAQVVAEDGTINRKVLGPLVFGDKVGKVRSTSFGNEEVRQPEVFDIILCYVLIISCSEILNMNQNS